VKKIALLVLSLAGPLASTPAHAASARRPHHQHARAKRHHAQHARHGGKQLAQARHASPAGADDPLGGLPGI
jgi:hypothetical protein